MEQIKQIGAYGLILKDNKILLINKVGGPYDGKLDLPGGTIEWGETPESALIRELEEEVGINIIEYEIFDGDAVTIEWMHKNKIEQIHHIGFFYIIKNFKNDIKSEILITKQNDDSKGARFYDISNLKKSNLSAIAQIELEKLGYIID